MKAAAYWKLAEPLLKAWWRSLRRRNKIKKHDETKCPSCKKHAYGNINCRDGESYVYCYECGYENWGKERYENEDK